MTGLSLKRLITDVSALTELSEAAVYERQRALVRAGLLKTERGRGPGSGVRGTPKSVALLLISLLATGNLSEAGLSTRIFAKLENKEGSCPLTGKRTFEEAVTAILASKELAQRVIAINVSRETRETEITYRDPSKGGNITSSEFGLTGQPGEPGLSLRASLSGYALNGMADIFAFDKGEASP
jgi:DNA-binding IscR family transcriptional regulator